MATIADKIRAEIDPYHGGPATPFIAAINAVLDLHKPSAWYEECTQHTFEEHEDTSVHLEAGDYDFDGCDDSRAPDRCAECTPANADDDYVPSVLYPCPTVRAIADELGVTGG
ncbi:hypothetical protein EV193_104402 [Herbihabitans rhizosphaerae]|uniref:Uncharacterized protein n=1 Tax=Herbihabitans rhizosphaerae TaxID=1872711 RepID=A0A4Q7KRZ0_9PSEU|nr:hypothetical protein [Herbihabitans rhizosphaerae]RZS39186.1 hypothetical protein EV193_104402 [Herbihabitans rhizosphaerae]